MNDRTLVCNKGCGGASGPRRKAAVTPFLFALDASVFHHVGSFADVGTHHGIEFRLRVAAGGCLQYESDHDAVHSSERTGRM